MYRCYSVVQVRAVQGLNRSGVSKHLKISNRLFSEVEPGQEEAVPICIGKESGTGFSKLSSKAATVLVEANASFSVSCANSSRFGMFH